MTVEAALATLTESVDDLRDAVLVQQGVMVTSVASATTALESASNNAGQAEASRVAAVAARDATQTLANNISSIALAAGSGPATALQYPAMAALLATITDCVDSFVYDCRRDSDGGEWTLKCSRTSLFREALNTATRGARREFPKVAGLVLRNSYTNTLTVYDLTDLDGSGVPRMWAVFSAGGNLALRQTGVIGSANNFNSVFALNGRIWVGAGVAGGSGVGGLNEIDLPNDTAFYTFQSGAGLNARFPVGLSQRNTYASTWTTVANGRHQGIVDRNVLHVHARVLPASILDAQSLPVSTVLACTVGGASVIHPNGHVASVTRTNGYLSGRIVPEGRLWLVASDGTVEEGPLPYATAANTVWRAQVYQRTTWPAALGVVSVAA